MTKEHLPSVLVHFGWEALSKGEVLASSNEPLGSLTLRPVIPIPLGPTSIAFFSHLGGKPFLTVPNRTYQKNDVEIFYQSVALKLLRVIGGPRN